MSNRTSRRALRAQVRKLVAKAAASTFDYNAAGHLIRVADPVAVAVLRRAFGLLLQRGGEAIRMQITEREAASFPRYQHLPGAIHVIAVGRDVGGRCTYSIQSTAAVGRYHSADAADVQTIAAQAAETAALRTLIDHQDVLGFPMAEPEGRA